MLKRISDEISCGCKLSENRFHFHAATQHEAETGKERRQAMNTMIFMIRGLMSPKSPDDRLVRSRSLEGKKVTTTGFASV